MNLNTFVFADLSTYNLEKAKSFYTHVFDWSYHTEDNQYFVAFAEKHEATGLYKTPEKFQKMKMPSFWMSYIQVSDRDKTVTKAKEFGGIVELTQDVPGLGKVALIRDPSGAGFTVYEGNKLNSRTKSTSNTMVWNELFVEDVSLVIDFYKALFGWDIKEESPGQYSVFNKNKKIAAIQELDESLRSKYQYWGVFFACPDRQMAKKHILAKGGQVLFEENNVSAFTDFSGEAFFYLIDTDQPIKSSKMQLRWRPITTLFLMILSLLTSWYWIFGLIFLWWTVRDILSGTTFLTEVVYRYKNPILYWVVILTWLGLSLLSLVYYSPSTS